MKIIFWHHQQQGPFSLSDLFHGLVKYAGTVTRLRILFWLVETGHEVYLYGNVIDGFYKGITSKSGNDIKKFILSLEVPSKELCLILNDPPNEKDWQQVFGIRMIIGQIILWAASPIEPIWLFRSTKKFLDRIVFISSYHQNLYRVYPGIEYSDYVYLGVDLDLLNSVLPKQKTGLTILSSSIPRRTKGFDHLLRAWRIVHQENPELTLLVSGSAKMHEPDALVGKTEVLDLDLEQEFPDLFYKYPFSTDSHNIFFLGDISRLELFSILKSSDLAIVNPNMHGSLENFCLSAVEAQAAGVPVIGGRAGSLKEVVKDGSTGLLVNGENPMELAKAIITLCNNFSLRRTMAENGPSWVQPMTSYSELVKDWVKILDETPNYGKRVFSPLRAADLLRKAGYGRARLYLKTLLKQNYYLRELRLKSYEG